MAQKRMFNLQIVDTDAFLEMPASTQNLYFHLCMRADDDGFIDNAKKIIKIVNSSEDDLKILFSKRFIIGFANGIIVIKHWRMHNYIAKDRYKETVYFEEKSKLTIKENGSYTECIQDEYALSTQIRLDKISIDKDRLILGALNNVKLTQSEYEILTNEFSKSIIDEYIEKLSCYIPNRTKKPYTNHYAVLRTWLKKDGVQKNELKIEGIEE